MKNKLEDRRGGYRKGRGTRREEGKGKARREGGLLPFPSKAVPFFPSSEKETGRGEA